MQYTRTKGKSVTATYYLSCKIISVSLWSGVEYEGVPAWNANRCSLKFSGIETRFSAPLSILAFGCIGWLFSRKIVVDHIKSVIHLFYYRLFFFLCIHPFIPSHHCTLFFASGFCFLANFIRSLYNIYAIIFPHTHTLHTLTITLGNATYARVSVCTCSKNGIYL